MRDRGQLSQDQEISQDRRSWIKASELPAISAKAEVARSQQPTAANTEWPVIALVEEPGAGLVSSAASSAAIWYVAKGDTHQGPLSFADLQRMINAREIAPSSLVWKDGMPNWVAATSVPGLRFDADAGAAVGSSAGSSPFSTGASGSATYPLNQSPPTSAFAVASLVLGVIWLCGIGSVLATIFGALALNQISRSNGSIMGKGLALAGLILGIVGIVLSLAVPIFLFLLGWTQGPPARF